jgi:4,5:9,10-diseco-3-hydroxy-5,9,17-trioxoandrosta-1(10),2-diene-4-oate hydrolase
MCYQPEAAQVTTMPERETQEPPYGRLAKLPSGYELHYHELGAGPAVVFVHGSGPGANAYSNFFLNYREIAAAGYRCLLPDMVGFGYSSKPTGIDYTLELFTSTLLEFLDAVGVRECSFVGNSLGGAISLKVAIDHPGRVTRLVVMGPGGIESREVYFRMPGIQKMVSQFIGEGFDLAGLRRLLELICHDPRFLTDELLRQRMNVLKTQPKDVLARMSIPDLTPELGQVKCPLLGFWGIEDHFCPSSGHEKILRAVADSSFIMYSRCGHWAMIERAEHFNRHVLEFLTRNAGR